MTESPRKCYAACFAGQFAWLGSSLGITFTARRLRNAGVVADVFAYSAIDQAVSRLDYFVSLDFLIVLLGYSLGVSSITYIQSAAALSRQRHVDLLLAVAGSKLGQNYPIGMSTHRSVLYTGTGVLSDWESPTFTHTIRVDGTPHLLMDFHPDVIAGIMYEVKQLQLGAVG